MFDIIKSAISVGGYKLTEIRNKIKKLYVIGDLTEAQMDELLLMASIGASTDAERPGTLQLIHTLAESIEAMEARIRALEDMIDDDVDDEDNDSDNSEQPVYPEWKPWDGISKDYKHGAIVSHIGELWESTFEGQNVWEPGTVDERFWIKYQSE